MTITVKLFARARDLAGADHVEIDVPDTACVRDVKHALEQQFPRLAPIVSRLFVTVGAEYARDEAPLPAGAEIACFPPVSGG